VEEQASGAADAIGRGGGRRREMWVVGRWVGRWGGWDKKYEWWAIKERVEGIWKRE
jgi:hypothetical protein